ncbi:hypothetical protein MTR_4g043995 [Medicago truncatula]|uniref:Uncharacterized protein n=1 Tax=Medicago truncatula TaxID=3880 RepID=A0A072UKC9_MEDTR|nr:hypothetical protein MTR_4g043995 [Medicago truncatula]
MALSVPYSSSCDNILPIVPSDSAIYNFILLSFNKGERTGGFTRYDLISSKAFWCSGSHLKTSSFFSRSNGLVFENMRIKVKSNDCDDFE